MGPARPVSHVLRLLRACLSWTLAPWARQVRLLIRHRPLSPSPLALTFRLRLHHPLTLTLVRQAAQRSRLLRQEGSPGQLLLPLLFLRLLVLLLTVLSV